MQSSSGRFVIEGLTQDSSLWALQKVLEDKTTIQPDRQKSIMLHVVTLLIVNGISLCCTLCNCCQPFDINGTCISFTVA